MPPKPHTNSLQDLLDILMQMGPDFIRQVQGKPWLGPHYTEGSRPENPNFRQFIYNMAEDARSRAQSGRVESGLHRGVYVGGGVYALPRNAEDASPKLKTIPKEDVKKLP